MDSKHFRARWRAGFVVPALTAVLLAAVAATPWSDTRAGTPPIYSIGFYRISSGGGALRNACFRVGGTLGQTAPGYSSGSDVSIVAGFWLAAPISGQDQLFFNGFQGC
jgi:hypothetical protein